MATKSTPANKPTPAETETPNVFTRFVTYVTDSKAELRKVSWPTLAETRKSTFAVLGFVAVMALLLGLVDLGLTSILKSFLS